MSEKPIDWRGSSLRDIKDDDIFTPSARKEAGHQLSRVQAGLEPDDRKPFDVVGAGTKEIRINLDDGWFRVMYVAKFPEAVYVLHCFLQDEDDFNQQTRQGYYGCSLQGRNPGKE